MGIISFWFGQMKIEITFILARIHGEVFLRLVMKKMAKKKLLNAGSIFLISLKVFANDFTQNSYYCSASKNGITYRGHCKKDSNGWIIKDCLRDEECLLKFEPQRLETNICSGPKTAPEVSSVSNGVHECNFAKPN